MSQIRFAFACVCFFVQISTAQQGNLSEKDTLKKKSDKKLDLNFKQFIIPTGLIAYGVIGLKSDTLIFLNSEIKEEVDEHIDEKFTIDDISQYVPMASIYALDLIGVKSKNNTKDKTIILATSYLIMGLTVNALKLTIKEERPDGTGSKSFPSGHTATAFMGAELLYQEYKHKSVWYGISGYIVATGTGLFRIYNNRHWLTDVAAGAGIGILSAKAGYWLYPYTSKIFNNNKKTKTVLVPFYDGKNTGFGFIKRF